MIHHFALLSSQFCQIPICPHRIGQTIKLQKSKSTQPRSQRRCPTLQFGLLLIKQWKKEQASHCCTPGVCLCQSVNKLCNNQKMARLVLFPLIEPINLQDFHKMLILGCVNQALAPDACNLGHAFSCYLCKRCTKVQVG